MALRFDEDSPWKKVLRSYFQDALSFFFPDIAKFIDWDAPIFFLDKEFQQISTNAKFGKRFADLLVRVQLLSGEARTILVHCEVQGSKQRMFEERMLIYAIRIYDLFQMLPYSLAILCDSNPDWRPRRFHLENPASSLDFNFSVCKVVDFKAQIESLQNSSNPFALVTLAHLKGRELRAKSKGMERKDAKFLLIRQLYSLGYNRDMVVDLFNFIDWIMALPAPLDLIFWSDLQAFEEEINMPYISSIERIGRNEGLKEGRIEGRVEGKLELVIRLLNHKFRSIDQHFTSLDSSVTQKINSLVAEQVDALADALLEFNSIDAA